MTVMESLVPYQAYKSKRHSRTLSSFPAQQPVQSNPPSPPDSAPNDLHVSSALRSDDKPVNGFTNGIQILPNPLSVQATPPSYQADNVSHPSSSAGPSSPISTSSEPSSEIFSSQKSNGTNLPNGHDTHQSLTSPSTSAAAMEPEPLPATRRTSTFRRVPFRDARSSPSPLRSSQIQLPKTSPFSPLRQLAAESPTPSPNISKDSPLPQIPDAPSTEIRSLVAAVRSPSPPRIQPTNIPSSTSSTSLPIVPSPRSRLTSTSIAPTLRPATQFYLPGFQPRGHYRNRTEKFTEARKLKREIGRIETTRLERRLEKLIQLHFSDVSEKSPRPLMRERRASSIFDLDFSDLRNKSAGELWKDILRSQIQGGKADVRAAEQNITPWQEDASVAQCPLCSASFHPITNRKHHCRMCGRIICSLPVKNPQRATTCSLLFVVDPKTGKIEEVGEGVDYGVRRRTSSQSQNPADMRNRKQPQVGDDEKFLRGVRICRDCRPVLLRQQYIQDAGSNPIFSQLYELFVTLEKEIEDALPQFQELIMSLKNDEQPTADASAARKRLIEIFSQYDTLAKRIRKLPCPGGTGSSQDRVQLAILTRANLFLQKNMFPLQGLPKPSKRSKSNSSSATPSETQLLDTSIDPDSELAHALQPLLEQEALLETFVQEAKARRKFEDAQTLKANLGEIRAEIDRIITNADRGNKANSKGKQRQL